jgi:hypothetical protein
VKVTSEQKSRPLEFRYVWVVPGKSEPGAKASARVYGWLLTAHTENGRRVDHLR